MKENSYRSILKSITWRVLATIDTFLISWLITGKIKFALSISALEVFTKMILYFFHERAWNKIKFGRIKPPEYEI